MLHTSDVAVRPDVALRPDVTMRPDVAVRPDDAMRPDVALRPDVTMRPDVAVRPDVTMRPDVAVRPVTLVSVCLLSYQHFFSRGNVDDLSLFEYLCPFFFQLNFIVLFPFLIKYYLILFIIIVFRLSSDNLSPVSSTVFPKGSVTGCDSSLGGGWMIFHFRVFNSFLFCVN